MSSESEPSKDNGPAETALDEARRLGGAAARCYDHSLRRAEARRREERLTELAWFSDETESASRSTDGYEMAKLRRRVEEQDYLLDAIENSAAWRLMQLVRGWFGRAW